jgi:hypothetical protein
MQNHRVRKRLDQMQETARKLVGSCRGLHHRLARPSGHAADTLPASCRFGCMRTAQRRATIGRRR